MAGCGSARLVAHTAEKDYSHRTVVQKLGVKHSRLALAWDWYRDPHTVYQTDVWMQAAQAAGVQPLVAFNRNWRSNGHRKLPSMTLYRKSFRLVRERYPFVTDFSAWNEANHTTQPTSKKPGMAARYYNAMRKACPSSICVRRMESRRAFSQGFWIKSRAPRRIASTATSTLPQAVITTTGSVISAPCMRDKRSRPSWPEVVSRA